MSKSLPEHMADFLMANHGPAFLAYRKRCLEFWEREYGPDLVANVKKILAEKYRDKK